MCGCCHCRSSGRGLRWCFVLIFIFHGRGALLGVPGLPAVAALGRNLSCGRLTVDVPCQAQYALASVSPGQYFNAHD
eukprot:IDg8948t1